MRRDYSLTGAEAATAVASGLADGHWFQADVDLKRLSELSERSNARAAVDTLAWVGLIIAAGVLAWNVRSTWWAVPAFLAYGALVGGAADARWHECGHGTAFRSNTLNDLVYYPACFMLARRPLFWRWSHFRHHTDTIIRGRDVEIAFQRPTTVPEALLRFTHVQGAFAMFRDTISTALGRITDVERQLMPSDDLPRMVRDARVFTSLWLAAIAAVIWTGTLWPILYLGGPTIYGGWLMVFFGITQHAGLQENVLDHRYSTRTVLMNPILRFLYLNMNYHIEHHMYPSVPYYRLRALHEEIKQQLPGPNPSTLHAYREIFTAFRHQSVDPDWEIPNREIPDVPGRRAPIVQDIAWGRAGDNIDLGPADLARGGLRPVRIDGQDFVLARTEEGSYVLADRICTHGEADMSQGVVLGCEIECPKHNGRFDLRTGQPTRKPVREPLGVQPVTESKGRLYIDGD